jgi:hypothetical protein
METTLYDKSGKAVAYVVEDGAIYLWKGNAVAYVDGEAVHGWNGKHMGWFMDGIVYDLRGMRIGFVSDKCPVATYAQPAKYAKQARYAKYARYARYARAALSTGTADQDLEDFLGEGSVG